VVDAGRLRGNYTQDTKMTKKDGRTRVFRRARALAAAYEAELGGALSAAQVAAVERAAQLNAIAWAARERVMGGDETIKLSDLIRLDSEARRSIEALRLPAADKPTDPIAALDRYLADNYGTGDHDEDDTE
jgi:hypothetical protein